jgi:hypothetical protein
VRNEIGFDRHARRLRVALAAVLVRDAAPELRLVRDWLDSWSGIGLIIAGMPHQGWTCRSRAYAARDWRANFFPRRHRALDRGRLGLGADAVAGGAASRLAGDGAG